jgi:uncharacterized protein (TIGR00375 family)
MIKYNSDLHIHGPFAGGTSKNLSVDKIAEMGFYKGLNICPLGDLTHKTWMESVFEKLSYEDETFFYDIKTIFGEKRNNFILSTEVQANDRTHHLILFPDKQSVFNFREKIKPYCKNLDGPMNGRPWFNTNAEQIAKICVEENLIFGPAHAYTPYFGIYAHYNSLKEAYGKYSDKISFLELGLSADSYLANNIEELKNITFLSNSDAHSFWPHRLGREFNVFNLNKPNYYEIEKALYKKDGRELVYNVGLNPKEGIYHKTRCKSCLTFYDLDSAIKLNWRCPCKGQIKKGVCERIQEISNNKQINYTRAEYKYVLPLAEIIAFVIASNNPLSEKVQNKWWEFIKIGENEINVLFDLSETDLNAIDETIAKYILAFRKGYVSYFPGGGGQYGKPIISFSQEEKNAKDEEINLKIASKPENAQRNLFDLK